VLQVGLVLAVGRGAPLASGRHMAGVAQLAVNGEGAAVAARAADLVGAAHKGDNVATLD